jgi:WD40 repeat protein
MTVRLWDATTVWKQTLEDCTYPVNTVVLSPDGKVLASASGKTVRLWDSTTGAWKQSLEESDLVNTVIFSPDGKVIATTSDNDWTVRLLDAITGACKQTFELQVPKCGSWIPLLGPGNRRFMVKEIIGSLK